jgi:hypothetical protein
LASRAVSGMIFRQAIDQKDLAALALIAKTQIPEYQAKPKEIRSPSTLSPLIAEFFIAGVRGYMMSKGIVKRVRNPKGGVWWPM